MEIVDRQGRRMAFLPDRKPSRLLCSSNGAHFLAKPTGKMPCINRHKIQFLLGPGALTGTQTWTLLNSLAVLLGASRFRGTPSAAMHLPEDGAQNRHAGKGALLSCCIVAGLRTSSSIPLRRFY